MDSRISILGDLSRHTFSDKYEARLIRFAKEQARESLLGTIRAQVMNYNNYRFHEQYDRLRERLAEIQLNVKVFIERFGEEELKQEIETHSIYLLKVW